MAFMAVQRTSHRLTIMLGKVPIRVVKVKRKKKKKKKRIWPRIALAKI